MLIKNKDAKVVDLGTKKIRKYTSDDKKLEVNRIVVNGRHPEDPDQYIYETGVPFIVYALKGIGKLWVGEEIYVVHTGDVAYVPVATMFAVEGENFEYLTFSAPAWYPEQAFVVDGERRIVEDTEF